MWVEAHGCTHNVCHLVISSVLHATHGVQNASLHGFETIIDVWHGTFQDYVAGVVQKPQLVHAMQTALAHSLRIPGGVVPLLFGVGIGSCFGFLVGTHLVNLISWLVGGLAGDSFEGCIGSVLKFIFWGIVVA